MRNSHQIWRAVSVVDVGTFQRRYVCPQFVNQVPWLCAEVIVIWRVHNRQKVFCVSGRVCAERWRELACE